MNVRFKGIVSPDNTSKEIGYAFTKNRGRKTCYLVQCIKGQTFSKEAMPLNKALAVMKNYNYNSQKPLTTVSRTIKL